MPPAGIYPALSVSSVDTRHFIVFILYFQVRNDYMRDIAEYIETDMAIKLGCIEMR